MVRLYRDISRKKGTARTIGGIIRIDNTESKTIFRSLYLYRLIEYAPNIDTRIIIARLIKIVDKLLNNNPKMSTLSKLLDYQ